MSPGHGRQCELSAQFGPAVGPTAYQEMGLCEAKAYGPHGPLRESPPCPAALGANEWSTSSRCNMSATPDYQAQRAGRSSADTRVMPPSAAQLVPGRLRVLLQVAGMATKALVPPHTQSQWAGKSCPRCLCLPSTLSTLNTQVLGVGGSVDVVVAGGDVNAPAWPEHIL